MQEAQAETSKATIAAVRRYATAPKMAAVVPEHEIKHMFALAVIGAGRTERIHAGNMCNHPLTRVKAVVGRVVRLGA